MNLLTLFKRKQKRTFTKLTKHCPGCTEVHPLAYFRGEDGEIHKYCMECEEWYIDHKINKSTETPKDSFTWGNNHEFKII